MVIIYKRLWVGSPGSSNLTNLSPCRYDNSLGLLTKKFIDLIKHMEDGMLDLNKASNTLEMSRLMLWSKHRGIMWHVLKHSHVTLNRKLSFMFQGNGICHNQVCLNLVQMLGC